MNYRNIYKDKCLSLLIYISIYSKKGFKESFTPFGFERIPNCTSISN